jgi:hypothetical protein
VRFKETKNSVTMIISFQLPLSGSHPNILTALDGIEALWVAFQLPLSGSQPPLLLEELRLHEGIF